MIILYFFILAFVGGCSFIVGLHLGWDRGYIAAQDDAVIRAAKEARP